MMGVREWWENNVMVVGRVGVWRCVLECLATELEYLDQYCLFPLFRLLMQLLFSTRVGRKPDGMTNSDQPSVTFLFSCYCFVCIVTWCRCFLLAFSLFACQCHDLCVFLPLMSVLCLILYM